jgi:hypothetical protein
MVLLASRSMKFNRDSNAGRGSRSDSKEKAKADAEPDSEHDRVRHHPGEQPQGTVLAAQQIVSKIKAAEHIQTNASDADSRDHVMVHQMIVDRMTPMANN